MQLDRVLDGKFLGNVRGPDGLPFIVEHATFREVWTNLANGNFVSVFSPEMSKIHKLTVIPDGTTTVIQLATGNFVVYGPDGTAIARNPGQIRVELLFDVDGEFLGVVRIVKASTGRSDDFCAAAVPVLIG